MSCDLFWMWHVHDVVHSQNSDSLRDARENSDSRVSRGKIADTSETDPRMHNEIVRIWGLTYIYIFRFRFLSIDH